MSPGHRVEGDATSAAVRYGNKMLRRVCWLVHMLRLRGVHCILENPTGSYMFLFPMLQALMSHWQFFWAQLDMYRISQKRGGFIMWSPPIAKPAVLHDILQTKHGQPSMTCFLARCGLDHLGLMMGQQRTTKERKRCGL